MYYEIINCKLASKSYPIMLGTGLLDSAEIFAEFVTDRRVVIVTDATVAQLHLQRMRNMQNLQNIQNMQNMQNMLDMPDIEPLSSGSAGSNVVILPVGEAHKTWQAAEKIFQHLVEHRHDRQTLLIALGGGVVGDVTGFAASCYMRGLPWIMVPTSLLAQVDAAVGGKTAINYAGSKNLIGSFYQPRAVIIDLNTLNTLPQREYLAGLAEVIKYGVIADPDFFVWLENNYKLLLVRNMNAVKFAVKKSCELKAAAIKDDEYDQKDQRIILNFGHTFGHALEVATDFAQYLHGEAVAIGMALAAKLSCKIKHCQINVYQRIVNLLTNMGLPTDTDINSTDYARLLLHMGGDKKSRRGELRFVLPTAIGAVEIKYTQSHLVLGEAPSQ